MNIVRMQWRVSNIQGKLARAIHSSGCRMNTFIPAFTIQNSEYFFFRDLCL